MTELTGAELDKQELYDDLLNGFIRYQYRLENPFPSSEDTDEAMINMYRSDPLFNRKVKNLVSGVMQIIDKHIGH